MNIILLNFTWPFTKSDRQLHFQNKCFWELIRECSDAQILHKHSLIWVRVAINTIFCFHNGSKSFSIAFTVLEIFFLQYLSLFLMFWILINSLKNVICQLLFEWKNYSFTHWLTHVNEDCCYYICKTCPITFIPDVKMVKEFETLKYL